MLFCFDYDGVIADSFDPLLRVCIEAKKTFTQGRDPVPKDFRTIRNLTFDALGQMIGIPEDQCTDYAKKVFDIQNKGLQVESFPAMVQVIKQLASEHTITVVTNSQTRIVASALAEFGIGSQVSAVEGGEAGMTKAQRIKGFQNTYGVDDDATYMIGDTIGDILAGKQAGVKTVAVTWGFQDRELLAAESPDYLCDKPEELLFLN